MEEKTTKRIILFVAGFYILIAALAVCILSLSGSVFKAQGAENLLEYIEREREKAEEKAEIFSQEDSETKLEGLEALLGDTVSDLKEEERETDEIVIESSTEPEPVTEPPAEEPEQPTEPVTEEPVPEEDKEILPEEKHYYSFITNNVETDLRMREEANENSKIIYKLRPGATGYVVYLGDEWSWVYADGYEGYCANEFLTLKEISEEDYPEELRNGS